MRFLTLDFLRQAVDPRICAFQATEINVGSAPCSVHRLALLYPRDRPSPASAILKVVEPDWPNDPCGPNRELRFYQEILPRLDIPKVQVYFSGIVPETQQRVILMQDLSASYQIPPSDYVWSRAELEELLRAYALFHAAGQGALPPHEERDWLFTYPSEPLSTEELDCMAAELQVRALFPALAGLRQLADSVRAERPRWAHYPVTLNHNDVFPSNAALPRNGNLPVILIDWDMVGWGFAELDLAYLFLQPYRSSRNLSPGEALRIYWDERQRLEGAIPPAEERQAAQQYTDKLLALALVPVAYQVALHLFPPGTKGQRYWQAMFAVLGERLASICRSL